MGHPKNADLRAAHLLFAVAALFVLAVAYFGLRGH